MPQIGFLMAFDGSSSGDVEETAFSALPPPPSALPRDFELAFSAGTGAVMPLPPQRPAATSVLFTVGGGGGGGGGGATTTTTTATEDGGGKGKRRRRRRSEEEADDDLLSLPSSNGAYYRCASTRALDARFGDILNRIRDAEAALAAEVVKRLVSSSSSPSTSSGAFASSEPPKRTKNASPPAAAMAAAAAAAAEVDALCALALTARERGWSRPRVMEEPVLWLRGGKKELELIRE